MKPATLVPAILLAIGACLLPGTGAAQALTSCDWEVAHPSDPDHLGPGKSSSEVDTVKAIEACRVALQDAPDNARFHYQLARALVYHAERNDGSDETAMDHLARAAQAGYTQAMFVYGLMLARHGETCAIEPWTRQAADNGLKAARIAYVDHAVKGTWADCDGVAGRAVMLGYLEGAAGQVSGYYENMLLAGLKRELLVADGE